MTAQPPNQSSGPLKMPPKPEAIEQPVTVRGIDIPFGELVIFIIKLTFASIPAGIILGVIWAFVALLVK